MAIINIYSKRQRKIRGEVNDVYQYNNIPHALRVQIIKIITDSIGFPSSNIGDTCSFRIQLRPMYPQCSYSYVVITCHHQVKPVIEIRIVKFFPVKRGCISVHIALGPVDGIVHFGSAIVTFQHVCAT